MKIRNVNCSTSAEVCGSMLCLQVGRPMLDRQYAISAQSRRNLPEGRFWTVPNLVVGRAATDSYGCQPVVSRNRTLGLDCIRVTRDPTANQKRGVERTNR